MLQAPFKLLGSVEIHEVQSKALENNALGDPARRQIPVYLPPGYGTSGERYPVVYFLHGFTGSSLGWLNVSAFTLNVPERIDRLIESKALPPFIGVFADGWSSLGGTQWINSPSIGAYQDYVADDLVTWADKTLRTVPRRGARAILGKSSGGYGALAMGCDRNDVFDHVGCHSGDAAFEYCYLGNFPKTIDSITKAGGVDPWYRAFIERTRAVKMKGSDHPVIDMICMSASYSPNKKAPLGAELPFELDTGRVRPEVWEKWLEKDPTRFVPRSLDAYRKLKSIFIDCGSRDEFNLRWGARMVVQSLRAGAVQVEHEEFDDGHMGINYRYDRSLGFLVPRLVRE